MVSRNKCRLLVPFHSRRGAEVGILNNYFLQKKVKFFGRIMTFIVVVVVVVFISHSCPLGFRIFYISFTFGVLFFLK